MLASLLENLPAGAVYFLAALAFALVWSTRREGLFHLALGGIVVLAAGAFNQLAEAGVSLAIAALAAMALAAAVGVLIESAIYWPLRRAEVQSDVFLLASFGMYLVLERIGMMWLGTMPLSLAIHREVGLRLNILGVDLTATECFVVVVGVVVAIAASLAFRGTTGRRLAALQQSTFLYDWRAGSSLRALIVVGATSGALAGMAAILFHLQHRVVVEQVGMAFLVPGFLAVVAAEGLHHWWVNRTSTSVVELGRLRMALVGFYVSIGYALAILDAGVARWLEPRWQNGILVAIAALTLAMSGKRIGT